MQTLVALSQLRHARRHPWQLALAVAGITLGVAVVLAVDLASHSARDSFLRAQRQLAGNASHRIVNPVGNVPEALYRRLRVEHGLTAIQPVVAGFAAEADRPGRQWRLLGLDPLALLVAAPDDDSGARAGRAVGDVPEAPVASVVSLLTADRSAAGLPALLPAAAGGSLTLTLNDAPVTLRGVATLASTFDGVAIVDIAAAQTLLGRPGELSQINVDLLPGAAGAAPAEALRALLPPGLRLEVSTERDAELADLSASFSLNLTALSLLALLVGMFLIYNAMTFIVVQRRRLLGLLRTVGVERRTLFYGVLGEALLLGLAGTLLGLWLGVWLGSVLVTLVTRTVSDLYYPLGISGYRIDAPLLLRALALGLASTVLAACPPALEATRTPPGAVLNRASLEARWRSLLPRQMLAGLFAAGAATLVLAFSDGLIAGFAGIFLLLIACALWVPGLVLAVSVALARLAPGPLGALALRGIGRQLSRTGVAAAALMIAFAATVGVGVMVDSFRSGVIGWLEQLLSADLYIAPAGVGNERGDLLPATVAALRAEPGVDGLSLYRWQRTEIGRRPVMLGAVELDPRTRAGYRLLDGDPERIWSRLHTAPSVLISEPLAYRLQRGRGAVLTLATPDGPWTLPIAGVFRDYSSEHGRVLIALDHYRRRWRDQGLSSAALFARAGSGPAAGPERLRNRLAQSAGRLQPLEIRSNGAILTLSLEIFERTFTITGVLRLLAIVVAVLGMTGALLALALERTREFATLRALGMTPLQVGALAWLQAGILGALAGLLALPVGLALAALLIGVVNRRAFGWTLPFQVDPWLLAQSAALAILAALLAGLYPLWRQQRREPGRERALSAELRAE